MSKSPARATGIRDIRLSGTGRYDLAFDDEGMISSVTPASEGMPRNGDIDGRGLLAIPGIVNAHAHIDKSWWGLPWQSYGGEGGTDGRIRHERARRDELGIPSTAITP